MLHENGDNVSRAQEQPRSVAKTQHLKQLAHPRIKNTTQNPVLILQDHQGLAPTAQLRFNRCVMRLGLRANTGQIKTPRIDAHSEGPPTDNGQQG
jgi:hypothetical protein